MLDLEIVKLMCMGSGMPKCHAIKHLRMVTFFFNAIFQNKLMLEICSTSANIVTFRVYSLL